MTGLERLREYAEDLSMKAGFRFAQEYGIDLLEIYKQIWSEQADERARSQQDFDNRRSELCSALGIDTDTGWSDAMSELEKRLMPPGMWWLRIGGEPLDTASVYEVDGEPVRIWSLGYYGSPSVQEIEVESTDGSENIESVKPCEIKRQKPDPIGADGLPIKKGDDVSALVGGKRMRFTVLDIDPNRFCGDAYVLCGYREKQESTLFAPHELTHTNPETPDSWEQLEEDAKKGSCDYFGCDANGCHGCPAYDWNTARGGSGCGNAKMCDLVRRAKALAERDEGE